MQLKNWLITTSCPDIGEVPRGPQQGKIASKISEILKISRVVYDKNH